MQLKFKSIGTTGNYVQWLKGFKDILPSVIVEVDLETQEFIAKCFPLEKYIVKYSKLSFEDAGLELSEIIDNNGDTIDWDNYTEKISNRVKVGIYEILGKVIDVENMFSATDHEMLINFDICNNVMYIGSKAAEKEYQATNITLKSMSLTMVIPCSQLSEVFSKCDDETFLNRVCNIGSPSVYEVSIDTINNLSKISSVFIGKSRDVIKFYSKEEDGRMALYAYDENEGKYDYLLGYYIDGEQGKTSTSIFKDNFLNATKGLTADTLQITLDTAGSSRMLIDTPDSKVVIAARQN